MAFESQAAGARCLQRLLAEVLTAQHLADDADSLVPVDRRGRIGRPAPGSPAGSCRGHLSRGEAPLTKPGTAPRRWPSSVRPVAGRRCRALPGMPREGSSSRCWTAIDRVWRASWSSLIRWDCFSTRRRRSSSSVLDSGMHGASFPVASSPQSGAFGARPRERRRCSPVNRRRSGLVLNPHVIRLGLDWPGGLSVLDGPRSLVGCTHVPASGAQASCSTGMAIAENENPRQGAPVTWV